MTKQEMETAIHKILRSVDKGDVIATWSESSPIDFDMDNLKSVEDINKFSIGLRLFEKDASGKMRVGNSSINSLSDIETLLKNTRMSAVLGDEMDIELPGDNSYKPMELYFEETAGLKKEEMLELGAKLLKRLKAIDNNAKISVGLSRYVGTRWIANASGFFGSYDESRFSVSASMILVEDGGSLLMVGDGDVSSDLFIDLDTIVQNIEWRYTNAQRKASVKTGYMPVLFTPEALGLLLEPIEIAANGKTFYKGISPSQNKVGEKLFGDKLTLIDDPFYKRGTDNYPFDDEGTLPKPLPIVENGVFKNFIFDITTARRMNRASTGHGRRNPGGLPAPSFSNIVMGTGDSELKNMIAGIDYGLLVVEFLGGGMSNVLAGDFSVNVELGYLIQNGRVKGRIKNTMISGNIYETFKHIVKMENKLHKVGGLYAPHILFDKVSVTGEE